MRIEKTAPEGYFRNNQHKGLVNVIYTSNWILEKMREFLEEFELTTQQYNILRILQNSDKPLSTMQIRDRLLDKMSDTSRIVDRLVLKGLVYKSISMADKRLVDVTISRKASQLLDKIDERNQSIDGIASKLSADELSTLNILLDKMREAETVAAQ